MSVIYEICWFDSAHSEKARTHIKRKRSDAAQSAIYTTAREMVASWAGLDTRWGWDFMREVMAEDISPPPQGSFRHFEKTLPRGDVLNVLIYRDRSVKGSAA
jgi:hypothetical protein